MAIEKNYTQSSKYGEIKRPSGNAANGNTGGQYGVNNCIHTELSGDHWWEVDLGRTFPVHDITVWARNKDGGVCAYLGFLLGSVLK